MSTEQLISANRASIMLGVPRSTIVRWVEKGTLPGHAYQLPGSSKRTIEIPESAVMRLIERRKIAQAQADAALTAKLAPLAGGGGE